MARHVPKYKILILGDAEVGKTSLLLRFCKGEFDENRPAVNIDALSKSITVGGQEMELEVHDTAGQERYRTLTAGFYRGADALLLVFDVTDRSTLDNVLLWRKELEKYTDRGKDIVVGLIGNKCDKEKNPPNIAQTAKDLADRHDWFFEESSAKTNVNVDKIFDTIGRHLLKQESPEKASSNVVNPLANGGGRSKSRFNPCTLL